jgi:hypothetical protein
MRHFSVYAYQLWMPLDDYAQNHVAAHDYSRDAPEELPVRQYLKCMYACIQPQIVLIMKVCNSATTLYRAKAKQGRTKRNWFDREWLVC